MGFLQRGFAHGNKRGFAVWAVGAAFTFTMKIIGVLLGGGGKIGEVSLFTMDNQLSLLKAALPPPPTVFAATVELSLGSYP